MSYPKDRDAKGSEKGAVNPAPKVVKKDGTDSYKPCRAGETYHK